MNMHLITAIPKKSGRRDPNGTGAFKHCMANAGRDGKYMSGIFWHCCSRRSRGLLYCLLGIEKDINGIKAFVCVVL